MKAISLRQPWAWAIIHGGKDVENRTWPTSHRGEILIHASKTFDMEGWEWIKENNNYIYKIPNITDYEMGGIVGKVKIVGCRRVIDNPWFFGPWGFLLIDPQPLPFYPCKGKVKIFDINYKPIITNRKDCIMPDKARNSIVKVVPRPLNQPYKVGEEERDFLVEEMIVAMEGVNKIDAEITPMKEAMKKLQKEADEARDKLVKGKPYNVEVEEIFDYEKGEIYCKVVDTGEKLPTRKMVDEDYQEDLTNNSDFKADKKDGKKEDLD